MIKATSKQIFTRKMTRPKAVAGWVKAEDIGQEPSNIEFGIEYTGWYWKTTYEITSTPPVSLQKKR